MKPTVTALTLILLTSACTASEEPESEVAWDLTENGWQCRQKAGGPEGGEFVDKKECEGLEQHDQTWPGQGE